MTEVITAVKPPQGENIPPELRERRQWVNWRLEEGRDGKPTKMPYKAGTLRKASTTDLMTWATFEEALEAYRSSQDLYSGIGFVFSSGDPYAGIDLDNCRDPETGVLEEWAEKIIDAAREGYVEVSPSGAGIHIIVEGRVRDGGMRKGSIEMYSRERFFTITGVLL